MVRAHRQGRPRRRELVSLSFIIFVYDMLLVLLIDFDAPLFALHLYCPLLYVSRYVANIQIIQGQVEGRTRLPLPPDSAVLEVQEPSLSFEDRVFMDTEGEEAIANRDRIYVLEGAIITWTKQIRKVLRMRA